MYRVHIQSRSIYNGKSSVTASRDGKNGDSFSSSIRGLPVNAVMAANIFDASSLEVVVVGNSMYCRTDGQRGLTASQLL